MVVKLRRDCPFHSQAQLSEIKVPTKCVRFLSTVLKVRRRVLPVSVNDVAWMTQESKLCAGTLTQREIYALLSGALRPTCAQCLQNHILGGGRTRPRICQSRPRQGGWNVSQGSVFARCIDISVGQRPR